MSLAGKARRSYASRRGRGWWDLFAQTPDADDVAFALVTELVAVDVDAEAQSGGAPR